MIGRNPEIIVDAPNFTSEEALFYIPDRINRGVNNPKTRPYNNLHRQQVSPAQYRDR